MPRYVAFLRAINVGGRIVKMDRLRALFEQQGYTNVETFVASGNVLFDSKSKNIAKLESDIERNLEHALGFATATLVRPLAELSRVCDAHHLEPAHERETVSVGFLRKEPTAAEKDSINKLETADDVFEISGTELYWLCKVGLNKTKITNARLERALGGHPVTFRNITTVRKLAAKVT